MYKDVEEGSEDSGRWRKKRIKRGCTAKMAGGKRWIREERKTEMRGGK